MCKGPSLSPNLAMKDRKEGKTSNYLPEELINDILSRLPVKSLLRFGCVCKSWRILTKTKNFIDLHSRRSKEANSGGNLILYNNATLHAYNIHHPDCRAIELYSPNFFNYYKKSYLNELPPPVLAGSCNGLLCFAMPHDRYVLYNPATRAYKELPKVSRKHYYGFRVYSLLAYDRVGDDYKVFELFKFYGDYRRDNVIGSESLIYSMKANSWKTIDTNVPYHRNNFYVANSCLRWFDHEAKVLRTFDLFTERYDDKDDNSEIEKDFYMVFTGKCDLIEPVEWKTDGRIVLTYVCSKDGNPIVIRKLQGSNLELGWSDSEDDRTEVRIPGLSDKGDSLTTAKPWVETLVSLP